MRVIAILAILSACKATAPSVGDTQEGGHGGDGDDSGTVDSGDTGETGDTSEVSCDSLIGTSPTTEIIVDVAGSEDFAFDLEGNVVHVSDYGGLVRENLAGESTLIASNLGTVSGTRVLPDGSYAINSVDRGAILKVTPDGTVTTLISGLAYPNGLELGLDGFLYVAENGADTVRRVDPETGEGEIIGRGMYAPNGLSFNHDHTTLFVGSFGGGVVYAIDREDDGTWAAPRVHGALPGVTLPEDDCVDLSSGDTCYLSSGGYGTCDADLACTWEIDTAACGGLAVGDTCTTTLDGVEMTSVCMESVYTAGDVYCSRVDADRVAACEGQTAWGPCRLDEQRGYCETSWEGVNACITETEYQQAYLEGCAEAAAGDACIVSDPVKPMQGVCTQAGRELYCYPPTYTNGGGFDGVSADSCGAVYATEYGPGIVWRWAAEGEEPHEMLDMRSTWIPNMHWGLGVGGFERDKMYIIRRTGGFIVADMGIEGKVDALEVLAQ